MKLKCQSIGLALAWGAFCATSFAQAAETSKQPNFVVIIADDLGYADMSFLPQAPADVKQFGTPGFDRLAATGTYFTNAYSTCPICSSSRAGIITGRYQQRWGNYWYANGGLPLEEQTIPEALLDAGYTTAKYGKTHMNGGPKHLPTLHGFEEYLGYIRHTWDYIRLSAKDRDAVMAREALQGKTVRHMGSNVVGPMLAVNGLGAGYNRIEEVSFEDSFITEVLTDKAVEFIKRDKADKPFYLHVAHNAVHYPTFVVEESWAKKTGARYVPWDRDAEEWGYPYWEPNQGSSGDFLVRWGHMGEIDPEGRRCYLANLLALDHSITRILDALEQTGQRENTVVVLISDNGGTINTYANNTPLSGFKYMFGEGGIRIPMLVSMPGTLPQNKVNDQAIVSTMDLFPTFVEMAGETVPEKIDGKSLFPLLTGERETQHEWLAWAMNRDSWVIRKGKWKLTNQVGWEHKDFEILPNGDVAEAEENYVYSNEPQLFNLEADIGETTNLIDQNPEVAEQLRALYAQWDQQMPGPLTKDGKPVKSQMRPSQESQKKSVK